MADMGTLNKYSLPFYTRYLQSSYTAICQTCGKNLENKSCPEHFGACHDPADDVSSTVKSG